MIATLVLAAVVAGPGAYAVDPGRSEAGFDLKATMHTVHGITRDVRGEVRVAIESDGALGLQGKITVNAASLDTDNGRRDAKMHGTSLDVATFPFLVFEPERFTPAGEPAADAPMKGHLTGKLTIRGTTRPVTIDATLAPATGHAIDVEGRFDVTWADFGVPDPSFAFVTIAKVVNARFKATFVPAK
jgi:polyisoprenoid-binding protein YceI